MVTVAPTTVPTNDEVIVPPTSDGVALALDLTETGHRLRLQRHRRENPMATAQELAAVSAEWYGTRPGAEHGDMVGRVRPQPPRP